VGPSTSKPHHRHPHSSYKRQSGINIAWNP
jgi:hypothetical protein